MNVSSISSTQSPSVSGVVAFRHALSKAGRNEHALSPVTTKDSSSNDASALASAIASAVMQLGFIPASGNPDKVNGIAASNAVSTPLQQQPKASQQIQQYKNVVSTYSNLAQVLSSSLGGASPVSAGSGSLTTVFENLWTSLGSSPGASVNSSGNPIPSLPSFLQALAQNFSESGVSGLRGVFVDTVA